jgi:organic radical activating enzyme
MRVTKEAEYSLQYLQEIIDNEKLGLLCTGGEPTFKPHIEDAASLLNELRYPISNVETNGYNLLELVERIDTTKNVKYIYSPKIFSSKDLDNEKNLTNEVKNLKNVFIKLVYENNEYIHDYLEFLSSLNINERIYIMPEGTTRESLIKNSPTVFDIIEKYMFNFSSRSHIIYEFV